MTPEESAREKIDALLVAAGWTIQTRATINLSGPRGVALVEAITQNGEADYLLIAGGKAIGTVEAKPLGHTLAGVEEQSAKYAVALPAHLPRWATPLPFAYESTGEETFFTNRLDPTPVAHRTFAFHTPETLLAWAQQPAQLAGRLGALPTAHPLASAALWPAQVEAVRGLEASLAAGRPRALIQMATGSGKTFTAVNFIYRLIKHAGARRVLFLVDRGNLGEQTLKEFQQFVTPDDGRKFTELYNVQHLSSAHLDDVSRVVIATIQRLYSMLRGEEIDEEADELSGYELERASSLFRAPPPVAYNATVPIETFDFIVTDECHRSIYNLWRQVLEYFDARLIGLTATPGKQTLGFFQQNLVQEYNHERAVADGVNVNYDVYSIRTEITAQGGRVDGGFVVDRRDRATRQVRWETLEDDLVYDAAELDRSVVAPDQIRTVIRTFREKLFTEIFPGRSVVPKTLIFAKDDSHAEDIVRIVREEFSKGNDFCQKITYRTTGAKPRDLIQRFRNSVDPRIAVTVDMIATGTDIKPLEIVMFMRSVKSRAFFEQMKGRGVRVISDTDFQSVTPDAKTKTHFVIVDCVGVCERDQTDSRPLEQMRTVPLDRLLEALALNSCEPALFSSLAGRLVRLEKRLAPDLLAEIAQKTGGKSLSAVAAGLLDAIDPDKIAAAAGRAFCSTAEPGAPGSGDGPSSPPSGSDSSLVTSHSSLDSVAESLARAAAAPLATNPGLRQLILAAHRETEQTIDTISRDRLLFAGAAPATTAHGAETADGFRAYLQKHHAEIAALQILYSRPYAQRLTEPMLKELEQKLRENHAGWTEDRLWEAFAAAQPERVKGRSQTGRFADLVALVRFALEQQPVLEPFSETVQQRFDSWLRSKDAATTDSHSQLSTLNSQLGAKAFSPEQLAWLRLMRDQIATSVTVEADDLDLSPFSAKGGLGKAYQLFGDQLPKLLDELNETLAA